MSELPVDNLISVDQAIAIIDASPVTPRAKQIALADGLDHVLAEELRADLDYPPFDKSLMDGYALRCADATDGAKLRVVGKVAAGAAMGREVRAGEAVAIMTGAPIPPGTDGIVPVEDVVVGGDAIKLREAVTPGRYIARRGSDCAAGTMVLRSGARLGPAQLAVAASVGAAEVAVFAKPRAAVLSSGDEIVSIDQPPGPSQIRNANSLMLVALLQTLHCDVTDLGHVRDDPAAIRSTIEKGLASDVLFVTGGMSMGKYDYVPGILRELGVELKITKLRIKPGKPFVFGFRGPGSGVREEQIKPHAEPGTRNPEPGTPTPDTRDSTPDSYVFGLPGNPVSAFVCTVRLASRLIARLGGEAVRERWIDAELESPLPANGPREFYQPAKLIGTVARPLLWKGSADLFTLAEADALLVRRANEPILAACSRVRLLEVPR